MAGTSSDYPRDRREFFRHGLRRLVAPLADFLEQRLPQIMPREHLRPPGALPEKPFTETCYRCGNCVEICPASAIRKLTSDDPAQSGTPYIDPEIAACIICEGLECMRVCPSGALRMVESRLDIRMGLARVHHGLCLRNHGQDCTVCVDRCPLGRTAIRLDEIGRVEVVDPGCVGCGVCQNACPTSPGSIVVEPL